MKCILEQIYLVQLLLLISFFFCKKKMFYSENIQYAYKFCWTGLYVNLCRAVYRAPSWTSKLELLWNILRTSSLYCKFWKILVHCYDTFIAYCFSCNIFHFELFRKENSTMRTKHAKVTLLYSHCWWQSFFCQWITSFAVKLGIYDKEIY